MDVPTHNYILERLEALKNSGFLSEYLIAWSGPSGKLVPDVTVWPGQCQETHLRERLVDLIGKFVPHSRIVVLRDEP